MLLAHVSDFHITAGPAEQSLVRPDAAEAARKVVADIAAFHPTIDAVVITGDVADGGVAADYRKVREILSPLSVPLLVVPGNHDQREPMREIFGDIVPFEESEFLCYQISVSGCRIIGLDSLVRGRVEGRLCERRLE